MVASVIGFLVYKGSTVISLKLVFGDTPPLAALLMRRPVFGGLFPAMVGTIALVVLAVVLAVPLGLAAGIYMAEYGRGRIHQALGLFFDILAGVPSIVVGLFGFSVAVFLHRHFGGRIYPCLLISALSLAFLVLPYLIRTTQSALEDLPQAVRLTAPALGATRLQNIRFVLLPRALPGMSERGDSCHRPLCRGHGRHHAHRSGGHRRAAAFVILLHTRLYRFTSFTFPRSTAIRENWLQDTPPP